MTETEQFLKQNKTFTCPRAGKNRMTAYGCLTRRIRLNRRKNPCEDVCDKTCPRYRPPTKEEMASVKRPDMPGVFRSDSMRHGSLTEKEKWVLANKVKNGLARKRVQKEKRAYETGVR